MLDVCRRANLRLRVFRARFSALVQQELARALNHLAPPNEAESLAVDAKQKLDLRLGASFTRLQRLLLRVGGRGAGDLQLNELGQLTVTGDSVMSAAVIGFWTVISD